MKIQNRLSLLTDIYEIHRAYASDVNTACAKGCAACCTCNVTATTLEGLLIYDDLRAAGRLGQVEAIVDSRPAARYQPRLTLNQMVALYAKGQEPPDETNDPSAGICPLLKNGSCSIYPVRPFGCRAMLSSSNCSLGGEAQMPPFILSVNNVIMQYLEAVDQPGGTGNLMDVLGYLSQDAHRRAYLAGNGMDPSAGPLLNRSFPVLMVPPEHRDAIGPLIQSLTAAVQANH